MCGRFTLAVELTELLAAFPDFVFPETLPPRYNISPTQPVAVVPNTAERRVAFFRWGLIPSWAKDSASGARMINARAETVAEKPAFRAAFRQRRCLVLADGFYEWRNEPGQRAKTPFLIRMASGQPFAFAGLWEVWQPEAGEPLHSCTILTTEPNALVAPIHDRMPVILPPAAYAQWLAPQPTPADDLHGLLRPYPAEALVAFPVSRLVNSPQNDLPACIEPAIA